MPILKNAVKMVRKDKKRTARNLAIRENLKTLIKKTKQAIEKKDPKVNELIAQVQKSIDKAVQKGTIKMNTGARRLSRIYALKKKIG